jgi:phosphatidylethanolamine/phosphatidyl-N-methylethanolamine N-methyltransferase
MEDLVHPRIPDAVRDFLRLCGAGTSRLGTEHLEDAMTKRHSTSGRIRDARYGNIDVYYKEFYAQMPCGSESGCVAKLAHRFIERPYGPDVVHDYVLEVGAGDGLHLPFVRHTFGRYEMTDINEASIELARKRAAGRSAVEVSLADAQHLPHADASVDRLIATCVLLHLPQPEQALREWRRVTRPRGGSLSIYVPNEPSCLTRTGRAVTSRRAAKKIGFEGFDLMIAREHINHGWGLDQMIRHVFYDDELHAHAWPIPHSPFPARVFTVYQVTLR